MLIKEACDRCNITKKAIEYYEAKNLITPRILDNGYRDYSESEISTLKEISVLRKCGISITDIKVILDSPNKSAALAKCKYITEIRMQRLEAIQKCMSSLINDYDIDREFNNLQTHNEDLFTIKERLVLAFPGNYGLFLALHFGRFLNEVIDTEAKRKAYDAIISYLDNVELFIPAELSEFLKAIFTVSEKIGAAQIEMETHKKMTEVITDTENYLERNRKEIEEYIEYKKSDEYKKSPQAGLQTLMLNFQKESGYHDILVGNMKILSQSYADYILKLESANEKLIELFPQAKDMYE